MENESKIKVMCDNTKVMYSHEKASIEIKSPTGKSITLYKKHLISVPQSLADVFWKCANDPMVRFVGEIELTKDEMKLALEFSKIPYFGKYK